MGVKLEACRRFNQANCVRPDCGLAHNCYILLWDQSSGNEECFSREAVTEPKTDRQFSLRPVVFSPVKAYF